MANPFYVHPGGDYGPALTGLGQSLTQATEMRRKRQAEDDIEEMREQAAEVIKSGDTAQVADFMIKNPKLADSVKTAYGFYDKDTEDNFKTSLFDFYKNPTQENAQDIVDARKAILKRKGVPADQTQETDSFMNRFSADPEGVKKSVEMDIAFMYGEDFKRMKELTSGETVKPTDDIKNFKYWQTLTRDSQGNPEKTDEARAFGIEQGFIKEDEPVDMLTPAIKEFEYGERHPKFKIAQLKKQLDSESNALKGKIFDNSTELRKEFLTQSKEFKKCHK